MLRDGTYTAWFRTLRGQGTATVHLVDGRISGGDSFFNYGGTYDVDGDQFSATLTTRRFTDGPTTVFGLDEVDLRLTGAFKGTIARCTGTSVQVPELKFEALLFLVEEQSSLAPSLVPDMPRSMSPSNVARLPKGGNDRGRTRNPFSSGSR